MRILAFESSAKAASVALVTDGLLTGEYFQNSGQTHSRTLMKLAADLLENCDLTAQDVDAVVWANGPGSFTGVRIGAAAAKGFCWGGALPCAGISTLESMAYLGAEFDGIVCCCMDARRNQVYNALFRWADAADDPADKQGMSLQGHPDRLCEDRAISVEELAGDLSQVREPVLLVGDGAKLVYDSLHQTLPNLQLSPEHQRQQRASGAALAGWKLFREGRLCESAKEITPNYLRLSQAERERLARRDS